MTKAFNAEWKAGTIVPEGPYTPAELEDIRRDMLKERLKNQCGIL